MERKDLKLESGMTNQELLNEYISMETSTILHSNFKSAQIRQHKKLLDEERRVFYNGW